MFKLINPKYYPHIKTFVNQYKYKVSVNSILDGNTKGEVFADNTENPTIVLIFDLCNLILVFGMIDISNFNTNFKELVDNHFAPISAKNNRTGLMIAFFPENYWEVHSNQIIEDGYLLNSFRWTSEFDLQRYQEFKSRFTSALPAGYQLVKITEEILVAEQNKEFKNKILTSWVDIDKFITNGFGFCIINNSKIIASAVSCDVSDEKHYEITIDTFDEHQRKKGLATCSAIAYIDHCLANNFLPLWETKWDNFASQNLATKIGFIGSVNENRFQFLSYRANNFLFLTYWHLNKNNFSLDSINEMIQKAFEKQDQQPTPIYIYICAEKLAEKNIHDQAIRLLNEYLKIDKSTLLSVKDNANFKPLQCTPEWTEMLRKYEIQTTFGNNHAI